MISSLTAEKLACVRGERRLFADLDFQIAAGEALVVEGANGVGQDLALTPDRGLSSTGLRQHHLEPR